MMSEQTYRISGMDCAGCAREVETGVAKLPGVQAVQVDFATAKMRLTGEVTFEALRQRVEALGKGIDLPEAPAPRAGSGGVRGFVRYLWGRAATRLALGGGAIILVGALLMLIGAETVGGALYIAAALVTLLPIARSGLRTLLLNHDFNINLLMTIAALGAICIGETLEAASVIFLFAIGEALEGYTADRARDSLRGLLGLAPAQARRLNDAGVTETVAVQALALGDRLLVPPGERIPMDGVVLNGSSDVNQAPITGESLPVYKAAGAALFAGTVNGAGALEMQVTRLAADNTLSRIIQLVEEAQSVRAPSQRLIDRFARWYTPGVVLVALAVALLPPLLFNAPFNNLPDGTQGWLYRALELLVIACPCSLVISTPVTIISAITAAARRGVLIKGGAYLEALGGVRVIAFDKTGTLTSGQPALTAVRSVDCAGGERCDQCDDVLALAAAVEQSSAHPLAKAVVAAAQTRGVAGRYAARAVLALAGRGVQGEVAGKRVTIGSHALFEAEHPHDAALCAWVDAAEQGGQTAMLVCDGDRVRGYLTVADALRPESADVLSELHTQGMKTVMLTGDNAAVAASVAGQVGVDDARAGLLPADKLDAVRGLLRDYGAVAMVGDGVNDAPALAAATVGIAMGGAGSAQALETADVALMADDLRQLPYALRLSRFARALIRQNIAVSLVFKLAVMLLALGGVGSLWLAVAADVGMSLAVTVNGMRPLRQQ
jgi:Cd2+/Zn2+-exporting ATPase